MVINLRSDTQTLPTAEMLEEMKKAPLGIRGLWLRRKIMD